MGLRLTAQYRGGGQFPRQRPYRPGLVAVRPFTIYEYLYPFSKESIANIAYFFTYDYLDGRNPTDYVQPMLEKMRLWQGNQTGDLMKRYESDGELTLLDSRPGRTPRHYPMTGLQKEVYRSEERRVGKECRSA